MTGVRIVEVLEGHYPNLTPADERELAVRSANGADAADLALRTCSCGIRLDGFYDYLDHLKEVLSAEEGSAVDLPREA